MKHVSKPSIKITANEKGFTMIELMIATGVFSFILLLATVSFVQIGRLFYKGVTVSRNQEVTRSIVDQISDNLQFQSNTITCENTGGSPCSSTVPAEGVLCIGRTHYYYRLEAPDPSLTDLSFLEFKYATNSADCNYANRAGSQSLIDENMRLIDIGANCNASSELCDVSLRLAYGGRDLMEVTPSRTAQCKGGVIGTQFCAVTQLSSTVIRRVR